MKEGADVKTWTHCAAVVRSACATCVHQLFVFLCVKGMAGLPLLLRALRAIHPRLPCPHRPLPSRASCCPVRFLRTSAAFCAGHNKWSKVKHIKGPKDEARARMFMKFGMMIRIAVKGECRVRWHVRWFLNWWILRVCRRRIKPRPECKPRSHPGAVQEQEHAQSIHRGSSQECSKLCVKCGPLSIF